MFSENDCNSTFIIFLAVFAIRDISQPSCFAFNLLPSGAGFVQRHLLKDRPWWSQSNAAGKPFLLFFPFIFQLKLDLPSHVIIDRSCHYRCWRITASHRIMWSMDTTRSRSNVTSLNSPSSGPYILPDCTLFRYDIFPLLNIFFISCAHINSYRIHTNFISLESGSIIFFDFDKWFLLSTRLKIKKVLWYFAIFA